MSGGRLRHLRGGSGSVCSLYGGRQVKESLDLNSVTRAHMRDVVEVSGGRYHFRTSIGPGG